jgi:SAM-dependent methyltransferase
MQTKRKCLICNKNDFRTVHCLKDDIFEEKFYILECKNCHFVFTEPLLSSNKLSRFYPEEYYSFVPKSVTPVISDGATAKKKITRGLKTLLLRDVYRYDFKTESYASSLFSVFLPVYRYCEQEVYPRNKNGGKVLDIGCGCGEYLMRLEQLNWEVYGVEVSHKAASYGRGKYGLNIFCGELTGAKFPDSFFDVVTMHHTLEHIPALTETLKEIRRILKQNGDLIISLPNLRNWERMLFGKFWWGWDVPRHLWHFSPGTLSRLLENRGFRKIKVCYQADMYEFFRNIKNMLSCFFPNCSGMLNKLFNSDKLRFITKYLMVPIGLMGGVLRMSGKFVVFAKK